MLEVDSQGRFFVILHKKHCNITLKVSTVHHDQADVVYVKKGVVKYRNSYSSHDQENTEYVLQVQVQAKI